MFFFEKCTAGKFAFVSLVFAVALFALCSFIGMGYFLAAVFVIFSMLVVVTIMFIFLILSTDSVYVLRKHIKLPFFIKK